MGGSQETVDDTNVLYFFPKTIPRSLLIPYREPLEKRVLLSGSLAELGSFLAYSTGFFHRRIKMVTADFAGYKQKT